ncbi:MAG TPA: glycosyltransferase family 4 protein, partial [bacterium]|nr:glycosyltransferase family 4 protein [bacterium]
MKLAVVFDDLIQHGGAEKLLLSVMEVFPQAPLYVPLMSKEWEHALHEKNFCVCTSFMQKLPFKKKLNRFYSVLGLHILAFENFDFSQFDVVLSISARYAHGIITKPKTKHICYMNSPGRMFWDTDSYFEGEKFLTRLFSFLLQPFLSHVRNWDFIVSKRVDCFVANSPIPRRRIAKYYKRDSDIIFPPV